MKFVLLSAALVSATIAPAMAQQAAAPAAAAPAAAVLNGDSPIEAIAAVPAGKASLEKHFTGLLEHPAYDQFKGMSLREVAPMSSGAVTEEKIAAVEADLKAAK